MARSWLGCCWPARPGSLIDSQNRMFLVPDVWSASDSTLIVPLDGSVRMQFQFQNRLP